MTTLEVDRSVLQPQDASDLLQASPMDARSDDSSDSDEPEAVPRSLAADVQALIEDGRTYLETELVYQKTRAAFVADRGKSAFLFAAVAALFGFLALIGLTVGLIIALSPLLTAWGASALVVVLLLVAAALALNGARKRWNGLMAAIDGERESRR